VYDRERRHPAPTDVVAQHLGYKRANNGTALAAIASLRSYGLLEKAGEGKLAAPREVEDYRFTADESVKATLRKRWLRTPAVFRDLLQKYGSARGKVREYAADTSEELKSPVLCLLQIVG